MSELEPVWQEWADRRPDAQVLHLDTAAAGRMSLDVRRAVSEHLRREAEVGAYVAEGEAAELISTGRADVAALLGVRTDGLAFVESGGSALQSLLRAWPLPADATVGVVASEWGPNLQFFGWRGLRAVELAAEPDGRVDLDALARLLASAPPSVVHLTQVASHRGLVQPVADAAALCRAAGVPLWVDAAQALGHVDTATGADAVYATSRKWLAGPRGVGMLGVAERWWDRLVIEQPVMPPGERPLVHWLDSHEANVAGRVGLSVAVHEFLTSGPVAVVERLAEVGRLTRAALAELPGWTVVDGDAAGGAITALRPRNGCDAAETRARLLAEHAILTTASQVVRAPRELTEPLLRISPHVECTEQSLSRLRDALLSPGRR
ncbi:MAG: aminotransferase class V-fold PLP-dependent enzyme [Jatrophihabitantaceae bacterium]